MIQVIPQQTANNHTQPPAQTVISVPAESCGCNGNRLQRLYVFLVFTLLVLLILNQLKNLRS